MDNGNTGCMVLSFGLNDRMYVTHLTLAYGYLSLNVGEDDGGDDEDGC